jgi:SRSO17 transposase
VDGSDYGFRSAVESLRLGYVVGVRADFALGQGFRQVRAKTLLAEMPADAWQRLSCGDGAKGPRLYDWVACSINCPEPKEYRRWLLMRRSLGDPSEVASFACGGPPETSLEKLVEVAGARWAIEDLFELAKGDGGLDAYEVRSWVGGYRHVTLGLFALAVLSVIRSRAGKPSRGKKGGWG